MLAEVKYKGVLQEVPLSDKNRCRSMSANGEGYRSHARSGLHQSLKL